MNPNHCWKFLTFIWTCKEPTGLKIRNNNVNGLSIVPKKNYCIIKLWLKRNLGRDGIKNININDTSFDKRVALIKKNMN